MTQPGPLHPASLDEFQDVAWEALRPGVRVALATLSPEGPQLRTVVLRAADRAAGHLEIHTDGATPKVAELAADPRVALLLWDEARQLQLRVSGHAILRTAEAALWRATPPASRGNYGTEPPPGRPIAGPEAYLRRPDPARLTVIRLETARIDAVALGPAIHRRAIFARGGDGAGHWTGNWVAP